MTLRPLLQLARQPLLLFDPGFQLSYGAVVSLLVLTGPIRRHLCRLPALSLLLGLLWLVLATAGVCRWADRLWGVPGLVLLIVGWWVATGVGRRLGRPGSRVPVFRRLPESVRSLVAAQAAIQLGIILPLSGLYFGHWSAAGGVVNLLAIPLIGVFVQSAILTGLLYGLPILGPILAFVPKTMAGLSGSLFYFIASLGSDWFPYPTVPHPAPGSVGRYYLVIALLWWGLSRKRPRRTRIRNRNRTPRRRAPRLLPAAPGIRIHPAYQEKPHA